ncbi:hypothetical protein EDB86DRAFT_2892666 [Lactarius hatsudake]|nr:hypothetical protein EDB86DRAFT_2892666 [Lactarius hatsudake]
MARPLGVALEHICEFVPPYSGRAAGLFLSGTSLAGGGPWGTPLWLADAYVPLLACIAAVLASCHPQFDRLVITFLNVRVVSKAAALLGRSIRGLKTYTVGHGLSCLPRGGHNFPVVIFVWFLLGLGHSRSRALGSTRQLTAGRRIDIRVGVRGCGSLPLGLLLVQVRPT